MITQNKRALQGSRKVVQLVQWRAKDCKQGKDGGVTTHRGPKTHSHYNGNEIEST